MAWEGLKAAIPAVLIGLLIEKLVSMIIPAAGAILTIIQGLIAAWGTVSRIITAFQLFFAFLKAVKGGNAGGQFAAAVAAAAVVVIDFVANWLLQRLMRPARAVGGRLRGIAQRIMQRIGGADGAARKPFDADSGVRRGQSDPARERRRARFDVAHKPLFVGCERQHEQSPAARAAPDKQSREVRERWCGVQEQLGARWQGRASSCAHGKASRPLSSRAGQTYNCGDPATYSGGTGTLPTLARTSASAASAQCARTAESRRRGDSPGSRAAARSRQQSIPFERSAGVLPPPLSAECPSTATRQ